MRDEAGIPVPRSLMLQLERRLLAKCVLYGLVVDQRAAPGVVAALLELHGHLAGRGRSAGALGYRGHRLKPVC